MWDGVVLGFCGCRDHFGHGPRFTEAATKVPLFNAKKERKARRGFVTEGGQGCAQERSADVSCMAT